MQPDVNSVMESYAKTTNWNDASKVQLLLTFIERNELTRSLDRFLGEQAMFEQYPDPDSHRPEQDDRMTETDND